MPCDLGQAGQGMAHHRRAGGVVGGWRGVVAGWAGTVAGAVARGAGLWWLAWVPVEVRGAQGLGSMAADPPDAQAPRAAPGGCVNIPPSVTSPLFLSILGSKNRAVVFPGAVILSLPPSKNRRSIAAKSLSAGLTLLSSVGLASGLPKNRAGVFWHIPALATVAWILRAVWYRWVVSEIWSVV
jgi:hypothetical protein